MLHVGPHDSAQSAVETPRFSKDFVRSIREFRLEDAMRKVPPKARIVAQTAGWGVSYQVVAAIVQLVCLGSLIRSVGREQFGLWMVIYALTMWAPLLMFGQGNIILTRLGQSTFAEAAETKRILTSSLAVCLAGSAVALLMVFVLAPIVPWNTWLHIHNAAAVALVIPTAMAALAISIAAIPTSLSGFALLAVRQGVLNHQIMIAAQLICLAGFLLGIAANWPLWALGSILVGPMALAGITLSAVGIGRGYFPRPGIAAVNLQSIKSMFGSALTIFLFDLATIFLQRTPELIVARLRGTNEVAALGAGSRLSVFLLAIIQSILIATWPMISEAARRDDWRWIRRALISSLGVVLLIWGAGSVAIWFLGPLFIEKWTGIPNLISEALFLAIILQALSQGLQSWVFTALSALSMYKTQLFAIIGAIVAYFLLAPALGQLWGAVGVLLAQSFGIIVVALPIGVFAVARCIRHKGLKVPIDLADDMAIHSVSGPPFPLRSETD